MRRAEAVRQALKDKEFHYVVVDVAGFCGLEDEDCNRGQHGLESGFGWSGVYHLRL